MLQENSRQFVFLQQKKRGACETEMRLPMYGNSLAEKRPVNRKLRKEFGDTFSEITKLIDAIGAKVSTRSSRALKKQYLRLCHIFHMYNTQPVILLCISWSLWQLLQDSTTCIQTRLQERAKTRGRMDCHYVQCVLLCKFPGGFLCQCLWHRVPFLSCPNNSYWSKNAQVKFECRITILLSKAVWIRSSRKSKVTTNLFSLRWFTKLMEQ